MSTRIRVVPRGPLVVELDEGAEIFGLDGTPIEPPTRPKVRFCRCGATSTAPFCDGAHNRTTFEKPAEDDA